MSARRALRVAIVAALAALLAVPAAAPAGPKKRGYKFGARVLRSGMAGKDVRVLQSSLNRLAIATPINGRFRPRTRKAVKKLEKRQRWPIDGAVSKKEAKRIRRLLAERGDIHYLYDGGYPTVTVNAQRRGGGRLEVVDTISGAAVASIPVSIGAAGQHPVAWNETIAVGSWAPDSSYQFRVAHAGTAGVSIAGGQTAPFLLRGRTFPVAGAHDFGGPGARFGAPRSGHTHQGQDVIAACGVPLVAAEGGNLSVNSYQAGGAGYYVVVRGALSGTDYVYMHMVSASPLLVGQLVYTGQALGSVGSTGSSSGCHLHFEHWSAPGWYAGGAPYDPLPELTYWDSYS